MARWRDEYGPEAGITVGVVALLLAAMFVLMLGERGSFSRPATAGAVPPPLPGVTLDDDTASGQAPVVTSLRSNSEAQRLGVRVGDRVAAVDGHAVRDMAALRAALAEHAGPVPVSLQVQRGAATWRLALDRIEPAAPHTEAETQRDDPEDSARRGR